MVIQLKNITKTHSRGTETVIALDNLSLDVEAGELVAIMGPSGSGKSTLLNVAGGLDTPDSGEVSVNGISIASLNATERAKFRREQVGYVFQDFNLVPTLTIAENVGLPLELGDTSASDAEAAARRALEELAIADLATRYPAEVSRGQAQRAAIARSFVSDGRILMADEPTGALDSNTAEDVIRRIRERVDAGATALLVTHETRFAAWADRVVLLRDGKIVEE